MTIMLFVDIVWLVFLIFISSVFVIEYSKKHGLNLSISISIYIIHFIMTVFYWQFSIANNTDSSVYYNMALVEKNIFNTLGIGTNFIISITFPLVQYLGFNYFNCFVFFSFCGLIGFLKLYKLLDILDRDKIKQFNIRIIYIILLLPQFHFWTCALGKDSLSFLATILIIESVLKNNKFVYSVQFILSVALLFLVRPYLFIFLILAFVISRIIYGKTHVLYKISFSFLIIGLFLFFKESLLLYFNIEDFSQKSMDSTINFYSEYSQDRSGSFIDPASTNFFMLVFSYLYRPFFYDAKGALQLFSSIENLLLLVIFIKFLSLNFIKYIFKDSILLFLMTYFFINLIIKSLTLYNLGLASRQKYIIIPVFFIAFYYFKEIYNRRQLFLESIDR